MSSIQSKNTCHAKKRNKNLNYENNYNNQNLPRIRHWGYQTSTFNHNCMFNKLSRQYKI